MSSKLKQVRHWRPKFSIRTLVIGITVICCYAACWGPTKNQGEKDVARHIDQVAEKLGVHPALIDELFDETWGVSAEIPLLISSRRLRSLDGRQRYYFWLFGWIVKLPFEQEIEPLYFQAAR